MTDSLFSIQPLFRELAEELRVIVEAEPKASGWNKAAIDYRIFPDRKGGMSTTKVLVNSAWISIRTIQSNLSMIERRIVDAQIDPLFYGFVLSITNQGEVDIKLNSDKECFLAPEETFLSSG